MAGLRPPPRFALYSLCTPGPPGCPGELFAAARAGKVQIFANHEDFPKITFLQFPELCVAEKFLSPENFRAGRAAKNIDRGPRDPPPLLKGGGTYIHKVLMYIRGLMYVSTPVLTYIRFLCT